jgi:hypothetical protein
MTHRSGRGDPVMFIGVRYTASVGHPAAPLFAVLT